MNEQLERSQRVLACLGDRSRFRVVAELRSREWCVTDLARQVGLSQSCTTRHLQALEREGLVRRVRQGKRVFFRLCESEPGIAGLLDWALARAAHAWSDRHGPRVARGPAAETRRAADPVSPESRHDAVQMHSDASVSPMAGVARPVTGAGGARFPAAADAEKAVPEDFREQSSTNRPVPGGGDLDDFLL
jgi:ArsR family transcriptional regulator